MRYEKAPIVEAILDLRVEPRPEASAVEFAAAFSDLQAEYPQRQEMGADTSLQITLGPGLPLLAAAGPVLGGFRYVSADGKRIFQARREAFVFSLLPPYENWEAFIGDAWRLWERYRQAGCPRKIVRAALRYVNRFNFEAEKVTLNDYFTIVPQTPPEGVLPSLLLSNFLVQLVLPQPDIEAAAVLNFQQVPPSRTGIVSVVLDIDLFREPLAWSPDDDTGVRSALDQLRERKNALFNACLTEEAKELIR